MKSSKVHLSKTWMLKFTTIGVAFCAESPERFDALKKDACINRWPLYNKSVTWHVPHRTVHHWITSCHSITCLVFSRWWTVCTLESPSLDGSLNYLTPMKEAAISSFQAPWQEYRKMVRVFVTVVTNVQKDFSVSTALQRRHQNRNESKFAFCGNAMTRLCDRHCSVFRVFKRSSIQTFQVVSLRIPSAGCLTERYIAAGIVWVMPHHRLNMWGRKLWEDFQQLLLDGDIEVMKSRCREMLSLPWNIFCFILLYCSASATSAPRTNLTYVPCVSCKYPQTCAVSVTLELSSRWQRNELDWSIGFSCRIGSRLFSDVGGPLFIVVRRLYCIIYPILIVQALSAGNGVRCGSWLYEKQTEAHR